MCGCGRKIDLRREYVSSKLARMSKYTNVTVVVAKTTETPKRDPKIQLGWDEAKLGAAWNTCKEGLKAILKNAKKRDGTWKYPRADGVPDDVVRLGEMCLEELDFMIRFMDEMDVNNICSDESEMARVDGRKICLILSEG